MGSNSLLEVFLLRAKQRGRVVYLAQYVAQHDLSDLQAEIDSLRSEGLIEVESVPSSDLIYRQLRRHGKGEAEAIAWSIKRGPNERPLFVTRDKRALDLARISNVPSTDLMGLIIELVESEILTKNEAKQAVEPWSDPGQQIGKPRDYKSFEATFAKRRSRGPTITRDNALAGPRRLDLQSRRD